MGFLDKAKSAAEQAAQKAKEGADFAVSKTKETADDVQAKRSLSSAYNELGKIAYELVEAGEIAHERLTPHADAIRELEAKGAGDAEQADGDAEEAAAGDDAPESG